MRSTGNFNPEWGYLAPAPSFMRTARIVLVATAVGATAGAGVVLSLVDHPVADGEQTAIATHAIVITSVQAATAPTASATTAPATANAATNVVAHLPGVQTKLPAPAPRSAAIAPPQIPAANGSTGSAPGVAALTDSPSGTTDAAQIDLPDGTTLTPDTTLPKKPTKHGGQSPLRLGTMLRRMFSDHAGTSYFPNRGL
jgi:hypothetical protein